MGGCLSSSTLFDQARATVGDCCATSPTSLATMAETIVTNYIILASFCPGSGMGPSAEEVASAQAEIPLLQASIDSVFAAFNCPRPEPTCCGGLVNNCCPDIAAAYGIMGNVEMSARTSFTFLILRANPPPSCQTVPQIQMYESLALGVINSVNLQIQQLYEQAQGKHSLIPTCCQDVASAIAVLGHPEINLNLFSSLQGIIQGSEDNALIFIDFNLPDVSAAYHNYVELILALKPPCQDCHN